MAERRVPRQLELDPAGCALVVIDAQALFMAPDGPFGNQGAEPVVRALNGFLPGCRALGVPIVFSNYRLRPDLADAGLLRDLSSVAAGHWSEGSPWIEVDPRIERASSDTEVHHHRPSGFYGTDLEVLLASHGTSTLLLAGLSVNNAISATARDAFARDIPALVVRDCVGAAAFEPTAELETYFSILDAWTAEVVDSSEVLARLGGPG
ncbi:MAG: cysteine hydrolase family protein [Gaiellaceae bacterium]